LNANEAIAAFVVAAFSFAAVLILKKDSLPPRLRRRLALAALALILLAFVFVVLATVGVTSDA